jgi:hypothetical protein
MLTCACNTSGIMKQYTARAHKYTLTETNPKFCFKLNLFLNSISSWDITWHTPLKVDHHFEGTLPPSSGLSKQSKKPA